MKKIIISDLTLREEAKRTDFSLSFKEKLEFARELDRLGVDVIENAPLTVKKADALLIRTLSALLKNITLSCAVGWSVESVNQTWAAVKDAAHPRLLVSLPVSDPQMEYIVHKKGPKMLAMVSDLTSAAAQLCSDVEFSAEDATRAEPEFLYQVIDTAIKAGAGIITLCDTAGKLLPGELADFIADIKKNVPGIDGVKLSVQCSDELSMATSCVFTSITAGVDQIKVASVKGQYPTITNVAHVFQFRGDALGICCGLDMTGIHRSIDRMSWLNVNDSTTKSGVREAASSGFDSESFTVPRDADRETLDGFVTRLGYDLGEEDLAKVYEEFTRIANKKAVGSAELDTIIASSALQVPPTFELKSYVINSGDIITATANISLTKEGETLNGLSAGDGPIDAAFLAIEQILGHHYELDDFRIMSVTEGREAVGKALIKLRSDGRLFSGQGISTDIIGASIRAYVDAVNKIVYEENMI